MATVRAFFILRGPGSNCDAEAHVRLRTGRCDRRTCHPHQPNFVSLPAPPPAATRCSLIPGGFTYGDDVAAGKILANATHAPSSATRVRKFRDSRAPHPRHLQRIPGHSSRAGLIVPPDEDGPARHPGPQHLTASFEDRWVHLAVTPNACPFLKGMTRLYVPVAHGEGNFVCRQEWILQGLDQAGQVVLRYTDPLGRPAGFPHNPNGSQGDIAGISDATGRVLGLMPHPERHALGTQHPRWTRDGLQPEGEGMAVFRNAVAYFTG